MFEDPTPLSAEEFLEVLKAAETWQMNHSHSSGYIILSVLRGQDVVSYRSPNIGLMEPKVFLAFTNQMQAIITEKDPRLR
jgi:hypothetical protein